MTTLLKYVADVAVRVCDSDDVRTCQFGCVMSVVCLVSR